MTPNSPTKCSMVSDLQKGTLMVSRMRTDGNGRLVIEMQTYLSFMNFSELGEMIKEHWREIGIFVDVKELERSLAYQRTAGNEHQIHVEVTWGAEDMYGHGVVFFPSSSGSCFGPEYGAWFQSNGEFGKEPPPPLARVFEPVPKRNDAAGQGPD